MSNKALAAVVGIIESGDDVKDAASLLKFCKANGLNKGDVEELAELPGPTDAGKVSALFARKEAAKAAEKAAEEAAAEE